MAKPAIMKKTGAKKTGGRRRPSVRTRKKRENDSGFRAAHSPAVFTIGHSTRPLETFIDLLRAQGVQRLIDVRTIPRSRHNPQFSRETLSATLHHRKIHYTHLAELGGLRHAHKDSQNTGWHNASFRGFADYMQTTGFEEGLQKLIALARQEQAAIMCAEAVPWRCHRSLIADALAVRGISVRHIISGTRAEPHALTPFAHVQGTRVTYPSVPSSFAYRRSDAAST
jgi:uncharacterized protein (DUF488 family)